jgi:hypothetical protein
MPADELNSHELSRQERREKKLQSRKARIAKSGKNIAKIYENAVTKRLKKK